MGGKRAERKQLIIVPRTTFIGSNQEVNMEDSLEKNHLQEQVKRIIGKAMKSQYMVFAKTRTETSEKEVIGNYRIGENLLD